MFVNKNVLASTKHLTTVALLFCPTAHNFISVSESVDGGWSEWGGWSDCSAECGGTGTKTRTRTCTHPAPAFGGLDCEDEQSETQSCNIDPCPGDD